MNASEDQGRPSPSALIEGSAQGDTPGQHPPAGMVVLQNGLCVKRGDWFFIESWGAWTPVPDAAIGQRITGAKVARELKKMNAEEMTPEQCRRYLREAGFNMEHIEAFDRAMAKARAILDEPNTEISHDRERKI